MLFDGLSDLQTLVGIFIDIANALMQSHDIGFAREVDVFAARLAVDVVDDVPLVDTPAATEFVEVAALFA